ncbi:hypothetical protein [uncultured Chitinophaga sp.]|uniref:hypothetical protein n=1 Tax=uncultured Chitinophaga sp. TaxID=339340 RepID=UPI0025D21306|nr:hypothetical protein [uncultured Chitinophaga sp.]
MKPEAFIKAGFTFLTCMLLQQAANAQIKMGGTAPGVMRGDALLELNSNKQGLLLPRVTSAALAQHPLDTAANGLVVYNTDLNSLFVRTSASWQKVLDAGATQVSSVNGASGAVSLTAGTGLTVTGTLFENDGVISFNTRNGAVVPAEADYTLNLLGDVTIASPATDQLLRHNGTGWANWTPDFLKASATLTQGSVLFAGASGVVTQANTNLFWDNTNSRLGIGNATPTQPLSVTGNAAVSGNVAVGSAVAATSTLQVTGSVSKPVTTSGSAITLTDAHYFVVMTGAGNVTLPPASTCPGRIYVVKKTEDVAVSVETPVGDTFERAAGPTSFDIDNTIVAGISGQTNAVYRSYTFQSGGGNIWYVTSN